MAPKKFLYEFQSSDLKDFEGIERDAFRKADELNDKIWKMKEYQNTVSSNARKQLNLMRNC